ncbi:MAG: hypothetical protein K5637_08525 [Lachnospiraceae bacterium]|nr:hypothetical protein [Lachnospiraceae bacterium]
MKDKAAKGKANIKIKKPVSMSAVMQGKPVKKIAEYYYFLERELPVRELVDAAPEGFRESAEIWTELNIAEFVMKFDSLIFQDVEDGFPDAEDQEYFEQNGIKAKYLVSFDDGDREAALDVLRSVLTNLGGKIASDTEDFLPEYTAENIDDIIC